MRKETILLTLGLLVFVTPLLGIPRTWKEILLFVLGACVMFLALTYRMAVRKRERTQDEVFHHETKPDTTPLPPAESD